MIFFFMIGKNREMSVIIHLLMVLQNFINAFKGIERLGFQLEYIMDKSTWTILSSKLLRG